MAAAFLSALPVQKSAAAQASNFSQRAEVQQWAKQVAKEHGLAYTWILQSLEQAEHVGTSARIMNKPRLTAGNKPDDWFAHRKNFLNNKRISIGREFVLQNKPTMYAVQERWKVPGHIVAAILGVESIFGRSQGRYRTLDVLATLSFDHERRASFFRKELIAYLKLCKRTQTDPTSMVGSFAGAIGMSQFMPSNVDYYGVDFDGDGHIDLNNSVKDAMASVANYLAKSGWTAGLPAAWECTVPQQVAAAHTSNPFKPNTTLKAARARGIQLTQPCDAPDSTPVMLVRLKSPKGDTWRLATINFTAILRYNRSYFYAETVRELAIELGGASAEIAQSHPNRSVAANRAHNQVREHVQVIDGQKIDLERTAQPTVIDPVPIAPSKTIPASRSSSEVYAVAMDFPTLTSASGAPASTAAATATTQVATAPASRAYDWRHVLVTPAVDPSRW